MNFLANFIMRGRLQAMTVASSLALLSLIIPPVSVVSSATIALVTLRRGGMEGLYVLFSSSLAAALLGYVLLKNFQFALAYAAVLWLPVWLISIILREGRHLSLAVEIAVLLGVLGVIGYYLYDPNIASTWKVMFEQFKPNADSSQLNNAEVTLDIMAHYLTGVVAAGSVFSLLFGLFLGRWWQANLYNPGGFRQEFLSLSTHPRLALGSIGIIALALVTSGWLSEVSWNIAILVFALYSIVGAAVLHTILARKKLANYTVPMLYVTLFLVPHTLLPIALLGLVDTWLNLRKITNQTSAKSD
ncbi:DUF2232 domain-containing protein [Methylocucumis oryzae]|uniref:Membrane protein n=1 Tax=Methylocucumis oryzae TaxID=1632867 RepID=A0A0F3IH42_9GAMM|nr:DUF2232 domain-containing protein [Methylocucumis oryzae]KJV06095.1 membrane protein [Methylocucumis oryzae]